MAAGIKVLCENFISKLHPSDTFGETNPGHPPAHPIPPWCLVSQDNRKTFLQRLFRISIASESEQDSACASEIDRQQERERGREREFSLFFLRLISRFNSSLVALLGDFLHHLTRQICALRSKKPAGRSITQCQKWAWPHQGVCQGRVACHSEGTARF